MGESQNLGLSAAQRACLRGLYHDAGPKGVDAYDGNQERTLRSLFRRGLVERADFGRWRITDAGREARRKDPLR